MKKQRTNIAVFASGRGSNFAALAAAVRAGRLKARIALLVCDNAEAGVLQHARTARIPVVVIKRASFKSRSGFESCIIKQLKEYKIDYIALAGFMRMLSPAFVRRYKQRIVNIHPALLPAFKGAHGIRDAFGYGVQVTGVTVHFVDEQMDHGPIILQHALPVSPKETLSSLEARLHRLEHRVYAQALQMVVSGKLAVKGRKVNRTAPSLCRTGKCG